MFGENMIQYNNSVQLKGVYCFLNVLKVLSGQTFLENMC